MSCFTTDISGGIFRYVISALTQMSVNAYATITNVNGAVQTSVKADVPSLSIILVIGPFSFSSDISPSQQITVTVYINNNEAIKFALSGISAKAGQQYIISVTFSHGA